MLCEYTEYYVHTIRKLSKVINFSINCYSIQPYILLRNIIYTSLSNHTSVIIVSINLVSLLEFCPNTANN